MMKHEMKLTEAPFKRMQKGQKTLELRLYDEKRRQIKLGDEIVFKLVPDLKEEVTATVTGLLVYTKFSDMLDDLPPAILGFKEEDRGYLRTSMYEIYTPQEEEEFGALGIRLKLHL